MKCKPCEGGVPPLKGGDLQKNLERVEGWETIEALNQFVLSRDITRI